MPGTMVVIPVLFLSLDNALHRLSLHVSVAAVEAVCDTYAMPSLCSTSAFYRRTQLCECPIVNCQAIPVIC